jgi:hypothetical protein
MMIDAMMMMKMILRAKERKKVLWERAKRQQLQPYKSFNRYTRIKLITKSMVHVQDMLVVIAKQYYI